MALVILPSPFICSLHREAYHSQGPGGNENARIYMHAEENKSRAKNMVIKKPVHQSWKEGYPVGAAKHMFPGSPKKSVLVVNLALPSAFVCHP
ncbi:hypothetical protein PO909_022618 [Leuciscus waleckii]